MLFLDFVLRQCNDTGDDDVIVSAGWILSSDYATRNRQANVTQILRLIQTNRSSGQVKDGFYKMIMAYFDLPDNLLPPFLKHDRQECERFAKEVYEKW